MVRHSLALFAFLAGMVPFVADAQVIPGLRLAFPAECTLGKDCFIQNYVDHDPREGHFIDFMCHHLSYDGHKGTDIAVADETWIAKGVKVVAAADGVVAAARDGMKDVNLRLLPPDAVLERECGNGVMLEHTANYRTQYCHLRRNSVMVKEGDRVVKGQELGRIGMSGMTEFPHLHFQVTKFGEVVDPFVGLRGSYECIQHRGDRRPLWERGENEPFHVATGVVQGGFAGHQVTMEEMRVRPVMPEQLPSNIPVLVFWIEFYGAQEKDEMLLDIYAPDGRAIVQQSQPLTRSQARSFYYIGKRNLLGKELTPGEYRAHVRLLRHRKETITLLDREWRVQLVEAPMGDEVAESWEGLLQRNAEDADAEDADTDSDATGQ